MLTRVSAMCVQWRGGGIAHGPVVRSHEHDLQRKVRRQGLACALSVRPPLVYTSNFVVVCVLVPMRQAFGQPSVLPPLRAHPACQRSRALDVPRGCGQVRELNLLAHWVTEAASVLDIRRRRLRGDCWLWRA